MRINIFLRNFFKLKVHNIIYTGATNIQKTLWGRYQPLTTVYKHNVGKRLSACFHSTKNISHQIEKILKFHLSQLFPIQFTNFQFFLDATRIHLYIRPDIFTIKNRIE